MKETTKLGPYEIAALIRVRERVSLIFDWPEEIARITEELAAGQ